MRYTGDQSRRASAGRQHQIVKRMEQIKVLYRRISSQRLERTLREVSNPRKVARHLYRLLTGNLQVLSNFYNFPTSRREDLRFCADLLGCPIEIVEETFGELEGDSATIQHLKSRYRQLRPDSPPMELGRFKIWFAVVRLVRPKVVVETGVHDGLSSSLILSALSRNGSGILVSIDLPSTDLPIGVIGPGWLVPQELKDRWRLHLGDARELLPKVLRAHSPVDIFIHDSDHLRPHQEFELRTAKQFLADPGLLLCDDPNLDMWSELAAEWRAPSYTVVPITAGFRFGSARNISVARSTPFGRVTSGQ